MSHTLEEIIQVSKTVFAVISYSINKAAHSYLLEAKNQYAEASGAALKYDWWHMAGRR